MSSPFPDSSPHAPGSSSAGPRADDELWLDALFGQLVAALADGRDLDPLLSLPPERSHLADAVRSLLATARRIVTRTAPEVPVVPGFDVDRLLGAGGMGKVYLATDRRLGRRVALKLLPARMASGRARARFEREARAVARLDHPLIVPVHGMGEDQGHLWFSMPYLEGRTLAQIASAARALGAPPESLSGEDFARYAGLPAAAPLPAHWRRDWVTACVRAAADAADALAHAHSQGVVHRDVKPSNVMVRPDGFAVVFDFGLADVEDETTLTLTRGFLGTPHYASPEQAAGDAAALDPRSDVWSLGATLYEMLTMAPPFAGPTTHEVLRRIQAWDPEPAVRANPAVPEDLDAVLRRCLRKEREERYGSAAELAADLRAVLDGQPVAAPREGLLQRGIRMVKRNRALTELLVEQRTRNAELRDLLRRAEDARRDAEAAREEAERERDRALRTASCFESFISSSNPIWGSRTATISDLFVPLVEHAESTLPDAPASRARILLAVARQVGQFGRSDEARELARRARIAAAEGEGPNSRTAFDAEIVELGADKRNLPTAILGLESVHERLEKHRPDDEDMIVRVMQLIATGESLRHRHDRAETWHRRIAARCEAGTGDGTTTLNRASARLGIMHAMMTDPRRAPEAVDLGREILADAVRRLGAEHPWTLLVRMNLGMALVRAGETASGIETLEESLPAVTAACGPDNMATAGCHNRLAEAYSTADRPGPALVHAEETLRIYALVGLHGNAQWATAQWRSMVLLDAHGRSDEARSLARTLLDWLRGAPPFPTRESQIADAERVLSGASPAPGG